MVRDWWQRVSASTPPTVLTQIGDLRKPKTAGFRKGGESASLPSLKLHGGRRALGDQLYDEAAELAQDALRHESVATTHDAYREKQAVETRRRVDKVLDGGDDDGS